MDAETERLIERTRQRREQLNQKMGKTPEAVPRKRRTPLSEDLTSNLGVNSSQQNTDDSPKRQCVRDTEQELKPDTPAIPGVKSRLQNLASQRSQGAETPVDHDADSAPVPTPRKSLSSPPLERARPAAQLQENTQPGSQRKSRFAQLASTINNWEDDLSHPTIVKEEEKKPRWQPPKPTGTTATEISSPKKTRAPPPPTAGSKTSSDQEAPSVSSLTKDLRKSPVRTGSKVGLNSSPKPFQPYKERAGGISPVKSPAASKTNLTKEAEPKQESKVAQLASQVTMRNPSTPATAPKPPAERPISARLANWEQKISENNKPDIPATPKSGLAAATAVSHTPKQTCTPARPLNAPTQPVNAPAPAVINPAQEQADVVQMRPKVRKSVDDEPTAHPVLARMSAWEQMTAANVVSDIKKVRPGDCTPSKTPAKKSPTKGLVSATPGKNTTLSPKKSFKDSIKERAAQVNPSSAAKTNTSPSKALSPKNASSAMKMAQEKLVQQTQSTSMAERLRQERMAELQTIQNRWKNGILKDDTDVESEEPPKPAMSDKKQTGREKARAGAPPDFHKSTADLVALGRKHAEMESSSSLTSQSTTDSNSDLQQMRNRSGYSPEDTEESVDARDAIGDLLDEAMDSDLEEASTSAKPPVPVMRKRPSHRKATEDGNLPFSINEYRASRNMQILEVKQTIVRNSQYAGMHVREEEVEMPTRPVAPAPRQSLQERIRELQELIQQEQNVIMQTSNALNQCCSSTSYFAGSTEQVECNRILLISCQKRQAYMMEIQRLRDTKVLDESGSGPKGSLTISDIRLPLKKEFVTKIGTSQDTTTYYFILLLRNGPQVICTQMLSTHDPMMRGSLDFPNLIKINGITGSFRLQLEIYSMSVSREHMGKDKKKKTPKKMKGNALTVQSPGGPMAVRTTSFSQVTSLQLTMKSLDKHCFNLERLSHLSPLHGTIYMNLKCLMEASVEERGFLTMFEDVSGFGSWHRRWCALSGNKLQYWKYPDDETRKDPIGYIDLKRCITEKVGLISRDICARPNTFELNVVRQPRKGEKDTLISRTYSTMTTITHMLSADTKEERIVWCNKLNRALANIRTWHSDAMRPISK